MSAFAAGGGHQQTHCVLFFDNERDHCSDMNRNVKNSHSVLVENSKYMMFDGNYDSDSTEIPTSLTFSNGLDYLQYQQKIGNLYAQLFETEKHICDGITAFHTVVIRDWIETNHNCTPRFIVFDWDRTLSVVEGILVPPPDFIRDRMQINEDTFVRHITRYVLGGEWRIGMLQDMFKYINDSGSKILILTNNPTASPNIPSRDVFLKMIKNIIPTFDDADLLCSYGYSSKSTKFNEYLSSLQLSGGKRRRKTKRRKTKRRNTKRRC
jgi:hypothetical protein